MKVDQPLSLKACRIRFRGGKGEMCTSRIPYICGKNRAIAAIESGCHDVFFRRERSQDLAGRGLIVESQCGCTIGTQHFRQRFEIMHPGLAQGVNIESKKGPAGQQNGGACRDHDDQGELAANRQIAERWHLFHLAAWP